MTVERNLANRRTAYRVRPDSPHELDLAVLERRYRVVRGRIDDVASGGVRAAFGKDALEPASPGERLLLALASERFNFDRKVWARLVSTHDEADERWLCFAFEEDDAGAVMPSGTPNFELFNRRARYRRSWHPDEPAVSARLYPRTQGDAALTGQPGVINDISAHGVCVVLDAVADAALAAHDELLLEFTLPGSDGSHRLPCLRRRREREQDLCYYGCEFDWSGSVTSLELAEQLVAYVQERLVTDPRVTGDRRGRGG